MTRVMASGVFDIIHPGHISYLSQAKSYGDELVVVVASDDTVRREKHEPITPDYMRAKIVEALKPVDRAIVGYSTGSIFDVVREIGPDVIVLGFDQHFDEEKLKKYSELLHYQALLIEGMPIENPSEFAGLICDLM